MRFHLDTSVLIDYARDIEPVSSAVDGMLAGAHQVGICAVQVAEYYSGLKPEARASSWRFLSQLSFWDISVEAAIQAGIYRYIYARQGKALSTTDMLIAAVARAHDAVLVTSNVKHFPMPDIRLMALMR